MRGIAERLGAARDARVVVIDTREELTVYLGGRPYSRRDLDMPTASMHHSGIHWRELAKLEQWLLEDTSASASQGAKEGALRVLVHHEATVRRPLRAGVCATLNAHGSGGPSVCAQYQAAESSRPRGQQQARVQSQDGSDPSAPGVATQRRGLVANASDVARSALAADTRLEARWVHVPADEVDDVDRRIATIWQVRPQWPYRERTWHVHAVHHHSALACPSAGSPKRRGLRAWRRPRCGSLISAFA